VAQRITRAKRKIADAGIPYRVPDPDELNARLGEVLAVIYLLLNEGYLSTAEQAQSRDLVEDAEWLATLLHQLMPTELEVTGLLALIKLHSARTDARFVGPRRHRRGDPAPDAGCPATPTGPLPAAGRHRRLPR
jgi:RNA polymerase sigma-70 factor (ECF subfamily)